MKLSPSVLATLLSTFAVVGTLVANRSLIKEKLVTTDTTYLTVSQLQQGTTKPIFLIDVRSPQEYAYDRIGNSPLVPIDVVESGDGVAQIDSLIAKHRQATQKDFTVVLYCHTHQRSTYAYYVLNNQLKAQGIPLQVLYGGISAWRQSVPADRDRQVLQQLL